MTIEFDTNDSLEKFTDEELRDCYCSELLQEATVYHLREALHWEMQANTGTANARDISDHHQLWAKLIAARKVVDFKVDRS